MQIGQLSETDLCVVIPASQVTGESGDPLSNQVIALINAMANISYAPLDFGETDDNAIQLWFISCATRVEARDMADHFINQNGDV